MIYHHDPRTKRQRYTALKGALWTERSPFDTFWADIAELMLPTRPRFLTQRLRSPDRRAQDIIDNTAKMALRTMASGLHAGLTSPARPWMRLTTPDPSLAKFGPVQQWLYDVTQLMLAVFNQSNFYTALPTLYQDLGMFGTAAMAVLEDDESVVRFYPYPIGSFAFGVDDRGMPAVWARESTYTVLQLVGQFGGDDGRRLRPGQQPNWSRFSRRVKDAWDGGKLEQTVQVCWMVAPNTERNPTRGQARYAMPFASCHFEVGADDAEQQFLRESGMRDFPLVTPRWDAAAEETYGTDCPGMTCFGDVAQLQTEQRWKGQAIEKMVRPPLQAPDTAQTQKVSSLPDDVTYVSAREGRQGGVRPLYEVRPDLSAFLLDIQEVQQRIKVAFYEPLFQMLVAADMQGRPVQMTAREIQERHEEKYLLLGPVQERTSDEGLKPIIDRVFDIMFEKGMIPEPPPELAGQQLGVKFTSLMAQAQQLVGIVAQDRFLEVASAITAQFPQTRYKVRPFRLVDNYGEILGIDPGVIVSDDEAQAAFDAEQQALRQQAQADQLAKTGQGLKALSGAPVSGDTVLQGMVQAAQGAMPGGASAAA